MKTNILSLCLALVIATAAHADKPRFLEKLHKGSSVSTRAKTLVYLPHKSKYYTWDEMANEWVHEFDKEFKYNSHALQTEEIGKGPVSGDNLYKKEWLFDSKGAEAGTVNYNWDGLDWELQSGYRDVNTYNTKGLLEEKIMETYDFQSASWEQDYRYVYTYDQNNRRTSEVYQFWATSLWQNSIKTLYTYDQNGNLTSETYQDWDGAQWVNEEKDSYVYSGNAITEFLVQTWDGTAWENSYRVTGVNWHVVNEEPAAYTEQEWDGAAWENSTKYNAVYDNNGGYVGTYQNWDGSAWVNSSRNTEMMDGKGNSTGYKSEHYDENNSTWEVSSWSEIDHTYDGDKILVRMEKTWDSGSGALVNFQKEEFSDFGQYASLKPGSANNLAGIDIYPNPASDVLNISAKGQALNTVNIFDLNGRLLQAQDVVAAENIQIDLSELTSGIYLLQLSSKDAIESRKIMKN